MAKSYTRCLLDIGHGMSNRKPGVYDPGAVARGVTEHRTVAAVVDAASKALDDVLVAPDFLGLSSVVRWFNIRYEPGDFVIAVHMDASDNAAANGTSVYYADEAPSPRNIDAALLASVISGTLGTRNRGARNASASQHSRLAILSDTKAPAFLVELGFITNEGDTSRVQSKGADALIAGIRALRELK